MGCRLVNVLKKDMPKTHMVAFAELQIRLYDVEDMFPEASTSKLERVVVLPFSTLIWRRGVIL